MSLGELAKLVRGGGVVALTGAGISTESGIPDYRGVGRRPSSTVQFQSFVREASTRRRYWARSVLGWPRIGGAKPNAGHLALAELEARGVLSGVITQNVDGLHQRAESRRVIELHGALERVRCLACKATELRSEVQERLLALNPDWTSVSATIAPDGDADLPADLVSDFRVADCTACGGILKPDVVLFGENVPRPIVDFALEWLFAARLLLVAGSSLAVFSGYRFVKKAVERSIPVAIVNSGPTRGDGVAAVRLDARLGAALSELVRELGLPGLTEPRIVEQSRAS